MQSQTAKEDKPKESEREGKERTASFYIIIARSQKSKLSRLARNAHKRTRNAQVVAGLKQWMKADRQISNLIGQQVVFPKNIAASRGAASHAASQPATQRNALPIHSDNGNAVSHCARVKTHPACATSPLTSLQSYRDK